MDFPPWNCKKHGDYTTANCPKCVAAEKRAAAKKKPKTPTYRVWLSQINQTYIDVKADSVPQAEDKALRKWKRENGPQVTDCRQLP